MTGRMPESILDRPTVYGARAKLGVIVPLTNTTNEVEWNRWAPADVSVHATRMALHTDTDSVDGYAALLSDVEHSARDLSQARVDVIAYGCTAGSMVTPVSALADHMHAATQIHSITTAQAIVNALEHLNVKGVAIATPYHDELNAHEQSFLEQQGFSVLAIDGLGYGANGADEYRNIAHVDASRITQLAQRVVQDATRNGSSVDAVLISCTDLPTFAVIEPLENELNIPVISSNSATLWAALRRAGVNDSIPTAGQLFNN